MALPTTRDATFVKGDTWTAATVNALQDAVIDHEAKLRALDDSGSGFLNTAQLSSMFRPGSFSYALVSPVHQVSGGASDEIYGFLPVDPTMRLRGWRVHGRDDATFSFTARLLEVNRNDGTAVQIGATATSAASGADQTLANTAALVLPVASERYYLLEFSSGAASHRIYGMDFTWDRPGSAP